MLRNINIMSTKASTPSTEKNNWVKNELTVMCCIQNSKKNTVVSTHTYVQHIPKILQQCRAKCRTNSSDGSCIASLKTVVIKSGGCCKF